MARGHRPGRSGAPPADLPDERWRCGRSLRLGRRGLSRVSMARRRMARRSRPAPTGVIEVPRAIGRARTARPWAGPGRARRAGTSSTRTARRSCGSATPGGTRSRLASATRSSRSSPTARARQGFTVVQLVVGPTARGPRVRAAGQTVGGFAWEPGWSRLRPAFFDAADRRMSIILGGRPGALHRRRLGLPHRRCRRGRDAGPLDELVARYAAYPVVWIIAGEASLPWYDRLFLPETPATPRTSPRAGRRSPGHIRQLDPFRRPLTVHPSPGVDAYASIDVFPDTTSPTTRCSRPATGTAAACRAPWIPSLAGPRRRARQPVLNGEVTTRASWVPRGPTSSATCGGRRCWRVPPVTPMAPRASGA